MKTLSIAELMCMTELKLGEREGRRFQAERYDILAILDARVMRVTERKSGKSVMTPFENVAWWTEPEGKATPKGA